MRDIKIFHGLGNDIIQFLEARCGRKEYRAGEIICVEDEPARELFFIEKGSVTITVNGIIIGNLVAGESFGEMSIIDMMKRSATITAIDECTILNLETKYFYEVYKNDLKSYTLIIMNIARELSRRLREADKRLISCPINI